jgi:hypothetical protein
MSGKKMTPKAKPKLKAKPKPKIDQRSQGVARSFVDVL